MPSYTAAQVDAVKNVIQTVRGNASGHSQEFFIYFFKKFPAHQNHFKNYKGKPVDQLRSVPQFASHVTAVVSELLETLEICHDSGALNAKAAQVVADHVSRGKITAKEYGDLFAALPGFLEEAQVGGFSSTAKAGVENACANLLAALKANL